MSIKPNYTYYNFVTVITKREGTRSRMTKPHQLLSHLSRLARKSSQLTIQLILALAIHWTPSSLHKMK